MSLDSRSSFTFRVAKIDASVATLVGPKANLVQCPVQLLGKGVVAGHVVDIHITPNKQVRLEAERHFKLLQRSILDDFTLQPPQKPELRVKSVTQTSIALEWPGINVGSSSLLSLELYKDSQRLSTIPRPLQNISTRLSGLDVNKVYSFYLVLKTTNGTLTSDVVSVKTHTWRDTTGLRVCFGVVGPESLLLDARAALQSMGAQETSGVTIDTTHMCCTEPSPNTQEGGVVVESDYNKAVALNIPVLQPQWILACEREERMVPIGPYYLGGLLDPSASIRKGKAVKKDAPLPPLPSIPATPDTDMSSSGFIGQTVYVPEENKRSSLVDPVQDRSPQEGSDNMKQFKFPSPTSPSFALPAREEHEGANQTDEPDQDIREANKLDSVEDLPGTLEPVTHEHDAAGQTTENDIAQEVETAATEMTLQTDHEQNHWQDNAATQDLIPSAPETSLHEPVVGHHSQQASLDTIDPEANSARLSLGDTTGSEASFRDAVTSPSEATFPGLNQDVHDISHTTDELETVTASSPQRKPSLE